MTSTQRERLTTILLQNSTAILFATILIFFGLWSPRFIAPDNFANIVKNASYTGIVAVGMTFVLLTAGIDISVGSNMYLSSLMAGLAMRQFGVDVMPAFLVAIATGMLFGAVNAFCIVRLKILPFIVTLATLVAGRGIGTALTESVSLDYPQSLLDFGGSQIIGIPMPIILFGVVALIGHFVLTRTPFGRQVYAIGNDPEAAKKAGINVGTITGVVYIISGLCAAIGGFILIAQIGRLDQPFGRGEEFDVISAAVLGGTSLFGGVGSTFGAVVGSVLIQMVQNGLVFANVNLYLQPMVQAFIIFLAVFTDSLRGVRLNKLMRRHIRVEA
jgi:ribose/xylose/arabinose/galactoside ABC-type transport system permease subunit